MNLCGTAKRGQGRHACCRGPKTTRSCHLSTLWRSTSHREKRPQKVVEVVTRNRPHPPQSKYIQICCPKLITPSFFHSKTKQEKYVHQNSKLSAFPPVLLGLFANQDAQNAYLGLGLDPLRSKPGHGIASWERSRSSFWEVQKPPRSSPTFWYMLGVGWSMYILFDQTVLDFFLNL